MRVESGSTVLTPVGVDAVDLLERYVYEMVLARKPEATKREHAVELTNRPHSGRTRTRRLDTIAEAAPEPFEAYDCKYGPGVEQSLIDEMGDLFLTASDEQVEARPCVATLATEQELRRRIAVADLQLHEVLYMATQENIGFLRIQPPNTRLN